MSNANFTAKSHFQVSPYEMSPFRASWKIQGSPGSVRFGYGLGMERFERFRFSVSTVPLRRGFSCVSVQFQREDGSGFGSWNTVPAVPVPRSVPAKTVPTVPVSGSGSVPGPRWKLHSFLEKAHGLSPKPPRFEGWQLNLHRDDCSPSFGWRLNLHRDDCSPSFGWRSKLPRDDGCEMHVFPGFFWPWLGWWLTLHWDDGWTFIGMTAHTVEPSSGWRFTFAWMTVEPSSGWRSPSFGWRLNLRRDDGSHFDLHRDDGWTFIGMTVYHSSFHRAPRETGLKNWVMNNGFQSWSSVLRERERVFRNASNEIRREKEWFSVCCGEQAHVPENMHVTLFVQALQLCNWNHMDICWDSPLRPPKRPGPSPSQKEICFADILLKIHAQMTQ